ncbi:MAG: VWA domain-containing protein [Terrimicrobiaceae bacterium]
MERLLTFQFAQPWWLLLLLLVPLRVWLRGKPGTTAGLAFSSVAILRDIGGVIRRNPGRWRRVPEDAAFALMIMALAAPRIEQGSSNDKREGIDIVFAVDISGSMGGGVSENGKLISKAEAMRLAVNDFVDSRPNDRFGMVGFAYDTWMMSPMTLDGNWIKEVLKNNRKHLAGASGSGTAVGNGILGGVELLKKAKGPSKIMVLATDGESNAGIAPMKAAEEARKAGIRIYTLGMGFGGGANNFLKDIADKTGGAFFSVANSTRINESSSGLREACRQIDRLERSKFEQKKFRVYSELFPWFVLAAMGILLADLVGRHTLWMRVP